MKLTQTEDTGSVGNIWYDNVSNKIKYSFYTPPGAVWSSAPIIPATLSWLAGTGDVNSTLAAAGLDNMGPFPYATTFLYDGTSWTVGYNISVIRAETAAAGTQNSAAIFGGRSLNGIESCTEEYNGSSWSSGGSLSTARYRLGGAGTQNAALAFGGNDVNFSTVSCTEEYNGSAWSAGGALINATCALAGTGEQNAALAIGGNYTACTEEYNGSSWSAGGALNTGRGSLASSGTQNSAATFGGNEAQILTTTEEYNGTSWSIGGNLLSPRTEAAGSGGNSQSALAIGGRLSSSPSGIVDTVEEYGYNAGGIGSCTL